MSTNLPSLTVDYIKSIRQNITLSDSIIQGQINYIDDLYGLALFNGYGDETGSLLASYAISQRLLDVQGTPIDSVVASSRSPAGSSITYDLTKYHDDYRNFIQKYDTLNILDSETRPDFAIGTLNCGGVY